VDVARALGEPVSGRSTPDSASRAVSAVSGLADAIGIPKGLSEYGLREHHVCDVVEEAMKSGNVVVNPRQTSKEQLAEILRSAL
jgi:alcohol dehydrogenase